MAPKAAKPPVPNPFAVSYAPTGRAACKKCGGLIGMDTVRFEKKFRSPWHDGFSVDFLHFKCGSVLADSVTDIRGWQGLKWKDIVSCAKVFDTKVDESNSVVKMYKERNHNIWELTEGLSKVKLKVLLTILDHTNIYYNQKKINAQTAAQKIADRMIYGELPPCPICSLNSLEQVGGEILCNGYVDSTACEFRYILDHILDPDTKADNSATGVDAEAIERGESLSLPSGVMQISAIKSWKPPTGTSGAKAFSKKETKKHSAARLVYDSESEDDIPQRKELAGMSFTSVGTTKPSRLDLADMIEAYGGVYTDDVCVDNNCLLVEEGSTYKSTTRYRTAVELGVPIVSVSIIPALLSRTVRRPEKTQDQSKRRKKMDEDDEPLLPRGLILRQRKYTKYYVLHGKVYKKVPHIKELMGEMTVKATPVRPPITPGSDLLRVDDEMCTWGSIHVDEGNNAYHAVLNNTNISTGQNSYYIIQLLESSKAAVGEDKEYCVLKKWGRIGSEGAMTNGDTVADFDSLGQAKAEFKDIFFRFAGICWDDRFDGFKPGKYRYCDLEGHQREGKSESSPHIKSDSETIKTASVKQEEKCSPKILDLSAQIIELIGLICNKRMMEEALRNQNVDISKMPLGSISTAQMNRGYQALCDLQTHLFESSEKHETLKWTTAIKSLTNNFYSFIPHVFSVASTPPLIDTLAKLKNKIEMMEQLLEISVAESVMGNALKESKELDPYQCQYNSLKCHLLPIGRKAQLFGFVANHLHQSHGRTHTEFRVDLIDLFECNRHDEDKRFDMKKDNKRILWHGSRLTNWVGILSQGLRCAPPEAPASGYMFDKGIYFADMPSKSCQYCYADRKQPDGLLILCEVAMGTPHIRLESQTNAKKVCIKAGHGHTWGVGKEHPDPSSRAYFPSPQFRAMSNTAVEDEIPKIKKEEMDDEDEATWMVYGVPVSNDKNIEEAAKLKTSGKSPDLLYNEFIVYDVNQIRMRYLARIRFRFGSFAPSESPSSSDYDSDD
eukprot:GHVO01021668.1.p1 GENE.GHVO01021668.1~~GHVO01021668.1.p1  ORF type:complete len:1007 (+),score=176.97 GHVO01021668.1:49-3069(+)